MGSHCKMEFLVHHQRQLGKQGADRVGHLVRTERQMWPGLSLENLAKIFSFVFICFKYLHPELCQSQHLGGDRWGRVKGTAAKTLGNNRVTSREAA